MRRRLLLAQALAQALVAGCATDQSPAAAAPSGGDGGPAPLLTPWRTLIGGFLAPPTPGVGLPVRPGTGMHVKWLASGALALRGGDLLLADVGSGRLWRADIWMNTVTPVAGAPVSPRTALALGPDLSAWVLDAQALQVLRFGRDGRLLQTWRPPPALPSPVALALADGGATLLVADGMGAQWSEQRGTGGIVQSVLPRREDGTRVAGVDGLAVGRSSLFVLDRQAAVVHRVQRDGRVLDTLGRGELLQPVALAVDREDRVFVVDAQDRSVKCLRAGRPAERLDAAALGVQRIGGIAVDERVFAVSDLLTGQVVLHRLSREAGP